MDNRIMDWPKDPELQKIYQLVYINNANLTVMMGYLAMVLAEVRGEKYEDIKRQMDKDVLTVIKAG